MKVLVTGGAGFIGSHCVEALLARGDACVVLDEFNDYYDPAVKRRNVAAFADRARVVEGDIRDAELVDQLFTEERPDAVLHLAARAGVRPSLQDPLLYQDVNVRGTMLLLDRARRESGVRFVMASSSSVYGANEKVPFHEDDRVDHPVSPYAATKKATELLAHTYHHLYGLPVTCLRFFTAYGPRQRPDMAIHKFALRMLAGEAVPMFGDGSTRRDYTYVSDIVDGVLRSIDRCEAYRVYNLGESRTTSLSDLIRMIGESLGVEPRIDQQPLQPGDVPITYADVSRARAELGYDPQVDLPEGLERFAHWLREQG